MTVITPELDSPPLIRIDELSKTFPGCVALDGLQLDIRRGEVLGLVGQNGCGKSTFIKVLSGFHQPDPGYTATIDGRPMRLGDPDAPHEYGIHFVHQDLGLLGDLSALENLAVGPGFATNGIGLIRWREQRRRTEQALHQLGYDFDVTAPVSEVSPSQRVGVAIARAMMLGHGASLSLLVLDEPTASMPQAEVDTLFDAVRRLRDAGVAVLFVSHRLDEVFAVADRVTVMRDGRVVDNRPIGELRSRLARSRQILGRTAHLDHTHDEATGVVSEAPLLRVRGLSGHRLVEFDLDALEGEVIGVTGLTGSGREELAPLLFGGLALEGRHHRSRRHGEHEDDAQSRQAPRDRARAGRPASVGRPPRCQRAREPHHRRPVHAARRVPHAAKASERNDAMTWMKRLAVKPLAVLEEVDPQPQWRQPAEGDPGPLAASHTARAHPRRADPGR